MENEGLIHFLSVVLLKEDNLISKIKEIDFSTLTTIFKKITELSEDEFDKYMIERVKHFERVTEHPDRSDVIFYPREGQEDSPEGILKEVKAWRAVNNKPGFKPE